MASKIRIPRSVTPWVMNGEPFTDANGYYGFVYQITCNHPVHQGKAYIGRKFFYVNFDKKTKVKDSDWRFYKTSGDGIKEVVAEIGPEWFTWEILDTYETRGGVVYAEVQAQILADVLHAKLPNGEKAFWNKAAGNIKFTAKETLSPELKDRLFKNTKEVQ